MCIPTVSEFVIENGNSFDVHVTGVLSSAPQFLPLMFQPQVLAPGQSAIIQLLFLPYRVERVEATLTVSSSVGAVTYDVTGIAAPNPYRLFPVVGHRLTVGERLDQSIVVHNPFEDPLHVREVFTTEDFLSLRGEALGTDGGRSAASGVWEISPGAEVEVVQLSIACAEPGLHTGYVHVKTDRDSIVVPVEVEVSSRQVSSALSLNFGVVTSSSAAQLDLWLMNSGDSDLAVLEIVPSLSDHGLTIDLEPNAVLIAGISTKVAKVTYAGGQRGRASGTLLVTTNHSSPALAVIEIPYQASVMLGGIGFSRSSAVHLLEYRVLEGEESSASDFPLYNYYNAPVSLSSASVETCAGFVEMLSDLKALPVEDTESWHRLKLLVHRHDAVNTLRPLGRLPFTCWLDVGTNVSTHRIPLHLTDGCLRLHFFEEEVEEYEDDLEPGESLFAVQLEDLSTREPRPFEIALSNPNPMAVPLHLQWISPGHDLGVCVGPVWKTRVAASDLPNATPAAHAEARRQARVNSSALRCLEYVNDDDFLATIPAGHSLLLLFRMRYSEDDDCEDCPLSVRLATPFEVIELRVSYDSLEAGLMSAVEGGNATLVLGRHQDVVVSTASSFPYDLFLTDVAVAGSGYAVRVLAHLIPPSALLSEADDGSSALDTGVYSVAVAPLLLQCASDPPPLGSTVLLTCLRRMLSSVDPGMTQHQRVGKLVFSLEARLMSGQLSSAHSHLRLLRQAWSEAFPRGFPLPPIQLVLEAPQTMHSLVIENVSVVSPLELLPLRTVLELPVLRVEQCAVVAVTVRNPFLMPLSFSLAVEGWRPRVPGNKQLPQFHSSKDAVRIEGQPIYAEETSSADSVLAYRLQSGLTPSPLPTLSPRLQLVTGAQVLIDDSGFLRSIAGEQRPPFSLIAEQETVVGPGQSAVVGHVLFVPNTVGGEPLKDDFSSTIFVRNNFTGLDKVDLHGRSGAPKIEISFSSQSTEQLVRGQSFQMTITIRNAGSVAVGVANVLLDGMSIRSFWRNFWPNAVRVVAPFKSSIAPGEQWMLEASGVWDCAMREERHDVAVVPSGRRAAELSVRAHFLVRHKEESVAACNQRGGYSDVFVIAIAHLLILVALVLLISLLRRRAEQIQSKRAAKVPTRNPSPPNTRLPAASSDDPDGGPLPLVETVVEPPSMTEEVHELPLSHGSSVDYDAELERDVSSSSEVRYSSSVSLVFSNHCSFRSFSPRKRF